MEPIEMNKYLSKMTIRMGAGIFLGSMVGFGYYYFIGCDSGTCAITSNPINSMIYGTVMGIILFWPTNQKKEKS